jgi:hypothetical protein
VVLLSTFYLRAKCKDCDWKVSASGSIYLHKASEAHRQVTGHRVKIKER